jgi:hypothetical protein
MIDIRPSSSSDRRQRKSEGVPSIHQLADLSQNEPILGMYNRKKKLLSIFSVRKFEIYKSIIFSYRTNLNRV